MIVFNDVVFTTENTEDTENRFLVKKALVSVLSVGSVVKIIRLVWSKIMENWEKQLSCAEECSRCNKSLETKDRRILSVFDHQPICSDCKKEEEKRPNYEDATRQMMAECIAETSKPYGDPASYCFHHFCPFKCS